jgi:uncharacterized phage-associated protein
MVFFAHGWMLGLHDRPMVDEEFEAWRYGPVNPSVYYGLSHRRGDPIEQEDMIRLHEGDQSTFDETEIALLDDVFKVYSKFSGMELSGITHEDGSPWSEAKKKHLGHVPESMIRKYYKKQVKEARAKLKRQRQPATG